MGFKLFCGWGIYPHNVALQFYFLCFDLPKHIGETSLFCVANVSINGSRFQLNI
jgi:hypothetical protein